MARTFESMADKAQALNEERLINLGAVGFASCGGKFKAKEYFDSVKRFTRSAYESADAAISASTLGVDAELSITFPEDRFGAVGAFLINLHNTASVPIDIKVAEQLFNELRLEIIPANMPKVEGISLRAHTFGFEQEQGEADEPDANVAGMRHVNEALIDGMAAFTVPLDFFNPGETFKVRISGLGGTTLANSFTGTIKASLTVLTYEGVKG